VLGETLSYCGCPRALTSSRAGRIVSSVTGALPREMMGMPTYISLINWTDQGVQNFKETVNRADSARQMAEGMGGTIKEFYWTVGPYDMVGIAEFPDDETGTAFLLALGSLGNVRTTTLRAYNAEEMTGILGKVS
jgi:uncharacterized protein with GYD domain